MQRERVRGRLFLLSLCVTIGRPATLLLSTHGGKKECGAGSIANPIAPAGRLARQPTSSRNNNKIISNVASLAHSSTAAATDGKSTSAHHLQITPVCESALLKKWGAKALVDVSSA